MAETHQELHGLIRQNDLLVSRYRIGRRVGAGAYGMIFSAIDEITNERVAVKAIPPGVSRTSSTALARFQLELKVVRNLVHPNIISLYDWGHTEEGLIFMILEYIEGETLDVVVRDKPMAYADAVEVIDQLAQALKVAHSQGVIHRDLKPANVMLTPKRHGGYQVKVLDFGMAKVLAPLEDESIVELTREGMAVGTPRYIAPEQARGLPVGPTADMYALGLLFYELLTGQQAVKAHTVEDAVAAHVSRQPLVLEEIDLVPEKLRPLLYRLLSKDVAKRVQSADELLAALHGRAPAQADYAPQIETEEDQDVLATFDPSEYQSGPKQPRKATIMQRIFGSDPEDLELDYERFQAFAPKSHDPVARRRQLQWDRFVRLPRTTGEWVETALCVLLLPLAFIFVGAQASSFGFGLRVGLSLAAPAAALVWATVQHSPAWNESFGRLCWVFCLGAIVLAHVAGPNGLADGLSRNATWFLLPFQDVPGAGLLAQLVTWFSGLWADVLRSLF